MNDYLRQLEDDLHNHRKAGPHSRETWTLGSMAKLLESEIGQHHQSKWLGSLVQDFWRDYGDIQNNPTQKEKCQFGEKNYLIYLLEPHPHPEHRKNDIPLKNPISRSSLIDNLIYRTEPPKILLQHIAIIDGEKRLINREDYETTIKNLAQLDIDQYSESAIKLLESIEVPNLLAYFWLKEYGVEIAAPNIDQNDTGNTTASNKIITALNPAIVEKSISMEQGRPQVGAKEILVSILLERYEQSLVEKTLAAESRAIQIEFHKRYPEEKTPNEKTIQRKIRTEYNTLKNKK